ncbi:MAG: sensor histidine kinase, partial [Gammaproteobacteria bacterium]
PDAHRDPLMEKEATGESRSGREAPTGMDFTLVLASCIHDMKNSLGLILARLDQIASAAGEGQVPPAGMLARLRHEGGRLNNQLIQLLAIYRIGHGQYFPEIEEHVVAESLQEWLIPQQELLAERDIAVEIDCPPELTWYYDRDLLGGVLSNILNNAFRYTRSRLLIRAQEKEGMLELQVLDDGPGYPPAMLTDPDHQQGIDFGTGSTGIGLYYASLVASLHRNRGRSGQIRLANEGFDGGGCFTIRLP